MLIRTAPATPSLTPLPRALLAAALTFGLCLLAQWAARGDPVRLAFWPAAGVAFAFGWRYGPAWTMPPALGALAYGALAYRDPALATAAAAVTLVGSVLPVLVLRRLGDWKPADYRLEAVVRFLSSTLLIGAPAMAAIAGTAAMVSPLRQVSLGSTSTFRRGWPGRWARCWWRRRCWHRSTPPVRRPIPANASRRSSTSRG